MKIRTSDGSISFAHGTLASAQKRTGFLASELGRSASMKLVSEDWWHASFKPETDILARAVFKGDHLHQVIILRSITSDDDGEWSVENELKRKSIHDAWLHSEMGAPPYTYSWGDVVSEYDQKGCVSEIIVTYAP